MVERQRQLDSVAGAELRVGELEWSSISLSEVLERGGRLEASNFDLAGKHARLAVANSRWESIPLAGDSGLANVFHRGRFKRLFVERSDLPIFQPSQITEVYPKPYLWISPRTSVNVDALRVKKGQILLTCSGTIGKATYVGASLDKHIFSHDLLRVEAKVPHDAGYLYAFICSDVGQTLIKTNNYGAVVKHIEPHHLADVLIPNPQPLLKIEIDSQVRESFQCRHESNALVDEAEALLLSELGLTDLGSLRKEIRQSNDHVPTTFQTNLSDLDGRLEASFHNPVVQSIVDKISQKADQIVLLGDPVISRRILLPSRFKRVYVEQGQGVLFFGGKELLQLAPKGEKFLSLKHHDARIRDQLTLTQNTVLVTCSGTLGKVALVPKHWQGWTANQHVMRIIPANDAIAGYIYAWLNTQFGRELILRFSYGAVVNEIDQHQMARVQIPLLRDKKKQGMINDLILEANRKRYEAYALEQEAIRLINEKVIFTSKV